MFRSNNWLLERIFRIRCSGPATEILGYTSLVRVPDYKAQKVKLKSYIKFYSAGCLSGYACLSLIVTDPCTLSRKVQQKFMMAPRVLLLGGHGKISLLMTPLLLQRSWNLTSLIRASSQESDVISAAGQDTSNLVVKIGDLEAINSQADAQSILDETKPDYVIFSAGEASR